MSRRTLAVALLAGTALATAACSGGSDASVGAQTPGAGASVGPGGFAMTTAGGFASETTFATSSTCQGPGDYSPGLNFLHVPSGTAELALTMVDTDIDKVHWIQLIPGDADGIDEHSLTPGAREITNDFGEATYDGPCPPAGTTHHYLLTLHALTSSFAVPAGSPTEVVAAIAAAAGPATTLEVTYRRS